MPNHVLVTGGTGLIGSALVQALAGVDPGAPPAVTVLTRQLQPAALPGTRFIRDLAELRGGPPPDAVVNLAGEPLADRRWTSARKQRFEASRIALTRTLVGTLAQLEAPPEVLVSGSAVGWYGPHLDDRVLTEELHSVQPGYSHDLCDAWEAEARMAEEFGTRVCVLRTGVVLASSGGMLGKLLPLFRFGLGGPVGSGEQWLSWVHRDDIVGIILHLLHSDSCSGVFNGTAPDPVTSRAFAQALGNVCGRPAVLPAPALVMRLMYGQMAEELLLAGQRAVPERVLASGYSFSHPTIKAALDDLVRTPAQQA